MEDYKKMPEWQALNRIWKACGADVRKGNQDDFKMISEYLQRHHEWQGKDQQVQEDKYLQPLSEECREFVLTHNPNVYHSCMAIIHHYEFESVAEMVEYYVNRYRKTRPYLQKNRRLVEEVAQLCWDRYTEKYEEF